MEEIQLANISHYIKCDNTNLVQHNIFLKK